MSFCSNRGTFVKHSRIVSDKEPIFLHTSFPKNFQDIRKNLERQGILFALCSRCVSKGIMSPLTAKVKCPHYGGQINFESEALEDVASFEHADSLVAFCSLKKGAHPEGYAYQ
jgi:hypothetical protein